MLYICIPSHDEAPTIGPLLWKIRKTLQAFPREYELLVVDDGSSDATSEILEPYTRTLPLTVVRHGERQGYARSLEELLRMAVERTDRPRRDAAIVMHADFSHGPEYLPELVKRLESGADIVVSQATTSGGEERRSARLVRKYARWLLRGIQVSGVKDIVSGFGAYRLFSVKNALRAQEGPLLLSDGWAARAELLGRVSQHARRVETIDVIERNDLRQRPSRIDPWPLAKELWREGGRLKIRGFRGAESRQAANAREEQELEEATR